MISAFEAGMDETIRRWIAGDTVEQIAADARDDSDKSFGMLAMGEAILGWSDVAEQTARIRCKLSREEAAALVRRKLDYLEERNR